MKNIAKIATPIAVISLAAVAAYAIVSQRPSPHQEKPNAPAPLVRYIVATAQDVTLQIRSHGTVQPRAEIDIVPEVSGRVVEVSPTFVAGAFFEKDEVLVRIDAREYELALVAAKADLAQAEVRVAREQAEAEVARREWKELNAPGVRAPDLVVRKPQLAEARALLQAAKARRDQAALNLERTQLKAPFDGRVRNEHVEVGSFLQRATPIATIYSVDTAEIRVPMAADELSFIDFALDGRSTNSDGPAVAVTAKVGGRTHRWQGRLVRTEGELDPRSRMVHAIVEVSGPYELEETGDIPLAVGLFVNVDIQGSVAEDAFVVPRSSVMRDETVFVIDSADALVSKPIDILRFDEDNAIVSQGLIEGERVMVSSLEVALDGMLVRPVEDTLTPIRSASREVGGR